MYSKAEELYPIGTYVEYNNNTYEVLAYSESFNKLYLSELGFIHAAYLTRHKPKETVNDIIDVSRFLNNWNRTQTTVTHVDPLVEWTLSESTN